LLQPALSDPGAVSKKKPWYIENPDSYNTLRREVENIFPELSFVERVGEVYIEGDLHILDNSGKVLYRFSIRVKLSEQSPRGLPTVWETGGRIPWERERHMNPHDGSACIYLPEEFWYENPNGISISEFIRGPLTGFLINQILIDKSENHKWLKGEWDHGENWIIEFYAEHLGTSEPNNILRCLTMLRKKDTKEIKGHWLCPCGSGHKLRDCHRLNINELHKRIPSEVTEESHTKLKRAVQELRNSH